MFCIAGIMADEEPKTPISANGNYNTSRYTGGTDSFLSDVLWSGRSEFTVMCWVSLDTGATSEIVYMEDFVDSYFQVYNDRFVVRIKNSSGGVTTKTITGLTNNANEFYHWTVTGSVSNNRLRVYRNGVLLGSSVMTYANATFTTARVYSDNFDLAQFNFYDRELTEAEVAEHYVEIDSQVGVLGYDAMTTAQRSGLIYSASFIDDISYAGNEFKDKSTSNISLSVDPPLTGQQIYVYTDVSTSQVYSVDSANFTTGLTSLNLGASNPLTTESYSMVAFLKSPNPSSTKYVMGKFPDGGNPSYGLSINSSGNFALLHSGGNQLSNYYQKKTDSVFADDQWHLCIAYVDVSGQEIYFNVDGVDVNSSVQNNAGNPWGSVSSSAEFFIGRRTASSNFYEGSGAFFGLAVGEDLRSVASDLYAGSQKARCWDSLQQSTRDMFDRFVEAGRYNGSSEATAIEDKTGNVTVTNNGVLFDGTGLSVEC